VHLSLYVWNNFNNIFSSKAGSFSNRLLFNYVSDYQQLDASTVRELDFPLQWNQRCIKLSGKVTSIFILTNIRINIRQLSRNVQENCYSIHHFRPTHFATIYFTKITALDLKTSLMDSQKLSFRSTKFQILLLWMSSFSVQLVVVNDDSVERAGFMMFHRYYTTGITTRFPIQVIFSRNVCTKLAELWQLTDKRFGKLKKKGFQLSISEKTNRSDICHLKIRNAAV